MGELLTSRRVKMIAHEEAGLKPVPSHPDGLGVLGPSTTVKVADRREGVCGTRWRVGTEGRGEWWWWCGGGGGGVVVWCGGGSDGV